MKNILGLNVISIFRDAYWNVLGSSWPKCQRKEKKTKVICPRLIVQKFYNEKIPEFRKKNLSHDSSSKMLQEYLGIIVSYDGLPTKV